MVRRVVLAGAGIGLFVVLAAAPAGANMTQGQGQCTGSADITFDDGGTMTVDGASTNSVNENNTNVTVPSLSGNYAARGQVNSSGTDERAYSGSVKIDMPAPLPDIGAGSWEWGPGPGTKRASDEETGDFNLPSLTPRGFDIPVIAKHSEAGISCAWKGAISIEGTNITGIIATAGMAVLGTVTTFFGGRAK